MIATVRHVTYGLGCRKFQAAWLLSRVYNSVSLITFKRPLGHVCTLHVHTLVYTGKLKRRGSYWRKVTNAGKMEQCIRPKPWTFLFMDKLKRRLKNILISVTKQALIDILGVQGFTIPGCQVAMVTNFCMVAPNLCGSSVWNLSHVTLLTNRTVEVASRFLKNSCTPFIMTFAL